ncbi:hypothetical protein ABMY26_19880 [Azospirillum sp. HJ39]|uniref:hypothetical protein n=1 Tax=Azospirillum sp. HJ39 TaxID=3159496 RepID=UPI0035574796
MGSLSFTNAGGSAVSITYLKINDTVLIKKNNSPDYPDVKIKNISISDKNSLVINYDQKNWKDFERFWLSIEVDGISYAVDLNRDHYFFGGDYRYPGEGSAIVYFFSGFNENKSMVQLNQVYGKAGDNNLTYCSDFKYLNQTTAT